MARKTSEGGYPPVPLYRREILHFDGLLGACRGQGMRMFRDAGALFRRGVAPNISPIDARGNASRFDRFMSGALGRSCRHKNVSVVLKLSSLWRFCEDVRFLHAWKVGEDAVGRRSG